MIVEQAIWFFFQTPQNQLFNPDGFFLYCFQRIDGRVLWLLIFYCNRKVGIGSDHCFLFLIVLSYTRLIDID